MVASEAGVLRIGELSRRVGVSGHVLRAWESRYGVLSPTRSGGGYRLYSAADEHRVRRMKALIADGLSAAEAAQTVRDEARAHRRVPPGSRAGPSPCSGRRWLTTSSALRQALDGFDEPAAQAVLDDLLTQLSLTSVLRDVVMPYLQDLGQRWEQGTASVAQEHFASNVLRGRLAGLARGWGAGTGPLAVLACPPGELHDLPLMVFGDRAQPAGLARDLPRDEHATRRAARHGRLEPGPPWSCSRPPCPSGSRPSPPSWSSWAAAHRSPWPAPARASDRGRCRRTPSPGRPRLRGRVTRGQRLIFDSVAAQEITRQYSRSPPAFR